MHILCDVTKVYQMLHYLWCDKQKLAMGKTEIFVAYLFENAKVTLILWLSDWVHASAFKRLAAR